MCMLLSCFTLSDFKYFLLFLLLLLCINGGHSTDQSHIYGALPDRSNPSAERIIVHIYLSCFRYFFISLAINKFSPSHLIIWIVCVVAHFTYMVVFSGHKAHYTDVIMGEIAFQITSLTIAYSTVYSDADQRKHHSSASLAFVWGIHRGLLAQMASNAENVSIWWRHHDSWYTRAMAHVIAHSRQYQMRLLCQQYERNIHPTRHFVPMKTLMFCFIFH